MAENQPPAGGSPGGLYARLSFMMFLQFAVWGAWSVVIAGHMEKNLHFQGIQIALVFGTTAWGSIVAPMIAGNIADRIMPVQIFTAISHLLGAVLLLVAWQMKTFWGLWGVMFVYSMTYMPTIALTNTVAFYHMGDSEKFGNIRVWGTLGWIAVQLGLGQYLGWWGKQSAQLADAHQADCLIFAAIAAVMMGLYCFSLPNTPPAKEAKNPYAFLEAFELTANRNFLILLVISFIVAIELPFYYNLTFLFLTEQGTGVGLQAGTAQMAMTIGQWGEVFLMCLLFPMIRKGGIRWTIFLGILAWPLRYTIFAIGHPAALVIASQALHGICYSFFFVGGMIAVERLAPKDVRASAQSLILFATNGCGMMVGHLVSGKVHDYFKIAEGQHQWSMIFIVPIVVTVLAGLLFILTFDQRQFDEDAARIHAEDNALAAAG